MAFYLKKHADGISFKIRVQPRSRKNMVVGVLDDALKIKLTAPPVDGAANALCVKFLAKQLNVPKSSLSIVSGETGRIKIIRLTLSKERDLNEVIRQLNSLAGLTKGKA